MLRSGPIAITWALAMVTSVAGQPKAGEVKENSRDGAQYVWIPAGTFTIGYSQGDTECRGEQAAHAVTITHGFWMNSNPADL